MKTLTSTSTIDDMTVSLEDIIGALDTTVDSGGDPHLTGYNGEIYDFMGDSGKIYNMFSSGTFQLNTLMTQFENNKTFMTSIGIKVGNAEVGIQEIEIRLDKENLACFYNSKPANRFGMQDIFNFNSGLKTEGGSAFYGWAVTDLENKWANVNTGSCSCQIYVATEMYENAYCPCLNFSFTTEPIGLISDGVSPHGVLGVTAKYLKPRVPTGGHHGEGVIEGEPNDYVVSSLFANDFKFNRFGQKPNTRKVFGFRSKTKVDAID